MLKNIKSKYIIKEIFSYLSEGKVLKLVKYNKYFKEKIELEHRDYRKFEQIEIEITLKQFEDDYERKKMYFINKELESKFYHIFFDNDNIEQKRNYLYSNEKIEKIKVILDLEIKSFKELFNDCEYIKSIKFIKFNRSDITDMSSLFYNCTNLTEINFDEFKTKNVTDMSYMFYNCASLTNIDFSEFITKKVKYMNDMFAWCGQLVKLDLKNFNTENVINMSEMFYSCGSLEFIDISSFNFDKVNNMEEMFTGCELLKLSNIPIFKLNSKNNDINIKQMFLDCPEELKEEIKKQNININNEAFALKL